MDILYNNIILVWSNYIEYLEKSQQSLVTSSRYTNIIFSIINLEFLKEEILLILAKKIVYKMAY